MKSENSYWELDSNMHFYSIFQFKSNLYHYAKANLSGEALMKIDKTSKEFSDCVQQLLNATQVLTFS